MRVLGIETSCDETGIAIHDRERGILAQRLHTQAAMHERYGGVVPELASRDHILRLLPLVIDALDEAGLPPSALDAIAYTRGPGLAGALLVGASFAHGLGLATGRPLVGIHHLEGHLLSPLLSARPPAFPFVALLVSGGHTQLLRVDGVGRYALLGETVDDAAGEAFDKSAKLLGLGYPGGPALAAAARTGTPGAIELPRPMLHSDDLDFSFSGLKTAVRLKAAGATTPAGVADLAHAVEDAITDVLVAKCRAALARTGLHRLVVSGGVSANVRLRSKLAAALPDCELAFPEQALCTDNGAMIAFAASLRLQAGERPLPASRSVLDVHPRWPLDELTAPDQAADARATEAPAGA